MTIPVRIRGAAGKRHAPRLPDHLFSSDPCFRVPPTGIPKPDPDEVPPALQWRGRLAGMACAMLLVFGSGGMASASSSGGLNWQFGGLPGSGTGIGLQLPIGNLASAGDVPPAPEDPAPESPAPENPASPLPRMDDWLPAAGTFTAQQSTARLDTASQDGNEQGEDGDPAAQINPQDIADVQPGQVARILLAAYDPSRYGVVMGVVRRVASNTTQPENAMPFYETIIAIPEVAFTKSPDEPVITAGMPLQVDILGGKRTVMNYIMTPIQKSLATAFREK
ncbi:MAG: hypothetical protein VW495_04520 [Rhodobiaceae bacterium]